ncbi:uncharacterized protein VTP21DRAFT_7767 [Calcarisporiella thermophila]|uniref:uncharacterized protein n=1 Tax=Calcarisporiella thermophila TaxID=911321 RepID=UPI00374317DC
MMATATTTARLYLDCVIKHHGLAGRSYCNQMPILDLLLALQQIESQFFQTPICNQATWEVKNIVETTMYPSIL